MSNVPKPRTEDERVFVSGYRYDSIRGFLVRVLIPLVGLIPLIGFPYVAWRFYRTLNEDIPDPAQTQLFAFLGMLVLLGLLMAFSFFFLAAYLKRKLFDTFIIVNPDEIVLRTGPKEIRGRWEDLKEMKVRDIGRIQTVTLVFDQGKITFDASMIDHAGPRPTLHMTLKGEEFRYPNLNTQPIKIRENELYGIAKKRYERKAGKG